MVVLRRSLRISSKIGKLSTKQNTRKIAKKPTRVTEEIIGDKNAENDYTGQTNIPATNGVKKPKIPAPRFHEDSRGRRYWLIKSEPVKRIVDGNDISFSLRSLADVDSEPWNGVRNYEARNNLLNMKVDDLCLFYHSNCKVPGIVGIAKVAESASPDEGQFDPKDPYFDAKSTKELPKWWCPRVKFYRRFRSKLSLPQLRDIASENNSKLSEFMLVKRGRLLVIPVAESEYNELLRIEKALPINDDIDCELDNEFISPKDD